MAGLKKAVKRNLKRTPFRAIDQATKKMQKAGKKKPKKGGY